MCIFTKDSKPKTAKKPIHCLKLVKKVTFSDGDVKYYALYGGSVSRSISYEIGETVNMNKGFEEYPEYQVKLNSKERLRSDIHKDYPYMVNAGLHSFHPDADGWKDAYSFMMEFFKQSPEDERGISLQGEKVELKEDGTIFYMNINFSVCVEVYECEIPIDTGKYGGGYCWWGYYSYEEFPSMAAREIRFVRQISNEALFTIYDRLCEKQVNEISYVPVHE